MNHRNKQLLRTHLLLSFMLFISLHSFAKEDKSSEKNDLYTQSITFSPSLSITATIDFTGGKIQEYRSLIRAVKEDARDYIVQDQNLQSSESVTPPSIALDEVIQLVRTQVDGLQKASDLEIAAIFLTIDSQYSY